MKQYVVGLIKRTCIRCGSVLSLVKILFSFVLNSLSYITILKNDLFQNIDNTRKKSSTPTDNAPKSSVAADPMSMFQGKADTFDGLDPLSMFAAQEANTKQSVPASAPASKKERVRISEKC